MSIVTSSSSFFFLSFFTTYKFMLVSIQINGALWYCVRLTIIFFFLYTSLLSFIFSLFTSHSHYRCLCVYYALCSFVWLNLNFFSSFFLPFQFIKFIMHNLNEKLHIFDFSVYGLDRVAHQKWMVKFRPNEKHSLFLNQKWTIEFKINNKKFGKEFLCAWMLVFSILNQKKERRNHKPLWFWYVVLMIIYVLC